MNLGLAGYAQFKVTGDSGSDIPPALRGFKDRVFALGPEFNVYIPKPRLTFLARYEPEFAARNRTQGQMDMITGKGPSARHEIFYFTESDLAAVPIDDYKYQFITQPGGWLGTKDHPNSPILVNLRLDPFERTIWPANQSLHGSLEYFSWYQYQFWRYVFVQQYVAKLATTAIEFPPMQKGAGFNVDAVKEKIAEAMKAQQ